MSHTDLPVPPGPVDSRHVLSASPTLVSPPYSGHVTTRRPKVNCDEVTSSGSSSSCYDYDPDAHVRTDENDRSSLLPGNKPKIYAKRWYVLCVFCLVNLLQSLGGGTLSPITQSCKAVFLWHDSNIALLSLGGSCFYLVCCFPFSWLLANHGLRVSLIVSILLLTAGFGVQCITMYTPWATWTMTIGQILMGGAAVIPLSAGTMLSSLWFPANQRTTATSLASICGFFGLAMGFVVGPLAVPENNVRNQTNNATEYIEENVHLIQDQREAIARLLYWEAGVCGAVLMLVLIYFPAKPPTPPSRSSHVTRLNALTGLRSLISNKQFLLILVATSVSQGIYGSFNSILNIDLHPIGVSQKTAGWLGFYTTIGGCVSGILVSWLSDRFIRRLKCFLLLLLIPMTLFLFWMFLLVGSFIPYSEASLYIATIIPGICAYGATPLIYELACESAYPVGEGITTVTLNLVCAVIACIFMGVLSISNIGVIWMNYLLVASTGFSVIVLAFTRVRYHRTDLDIQQIIEPPSTSP